MPHSYYLIVFSNSCRSEPSIDERWSNHPKVSTRRVLTTRSARRVPQPHREFLSEPVFEPEARCSAPGELASARWGEERKKQSRAPGGLFFRGFLLAEQKKATQGAGAEPPAIMQLSAAAGRSTEDANLPTKKQNKICNRMNRH